MTRGLCKAPAHRSSSPRRTSHPRHATPPFQQMEPTREPLALAQRIPTCPDFLFLLSNLFFPSLNITTWQKTFSFQQQRQRAHPLCPALPQPAVHCSGTSPLRSFPLPTNSPLYLPIHKAVRPTYRPTPASCPPIRTAAALDTFFLLPDTSRARLCGTHLVAAAAPCQPFPLTFKTTPHTARTAAG